MTKDEAIKILERIQDPDPHEGTLTDQVVANGTGKKEDYCETVLFQSPALHAMSVTIRFGIGEKEYKELVECVVRDMAEKIFNKIHEMTLEEFYNYVLRLRRCDEETD